jgi:Clostripain family
MTNEVPKLKWTVMVYMVADTGDSFYRDAMANIAAMTNAGFDDQVKVVVHADAPSPWVTKCWEVTGATKVQNGNCREIDCGHRRVLDFVEKYVKDSNYEAKNYLLVLWGHGEGIDWREKVLGKRPTKEVGKRFAPGSAGVMEVGELGKALKEMHEELEKYIKNKVVLGFDACLMGMVEVYDEIQPYVGWAVAANDEIPDTGWPYKDILNQLGQKPGIDPKTLAEDIVDVCAKWYSSNSSGSKVSFCACNLATSDALCSAAKELTNELVERIKEDSVRNAIREARDFAEDLREKAYIDLNAFCKKLKAQLSGNGAKLQQPGDATANGIHGAADSVIQALENFAFKHEFSDEYPYKYYEDSRAVSICFPESPDLAGSMPDLQVDWKSYKKLKFSLKTEWPKLLREFWGVPKGVGFDSEEEGGTNGDRTKDEKGRAAGQG